LDLNSLARVETAARELIATEPKIHILINNAGVMGLPFTMTDDDIESHFGINHVGPTLFTQRLLPTIRDSGTPEDPSRIVFTSSMGHYWTYSGGVCLTLDTINNKNSYYSMTAYGHSKLVNILTANYLARQVSNDSDRPTVLINSVHPGIVHSELGRNMRHSHGWIGELVVKFIYMCLAMPSEDGALTSLYAATANEVKEKGYNGKFFVPYGRCSTPSGYAQNEKLQDRLWQFTQSIINEKLRY
jgi:NAD(P)-dependent dehydrogenase (short-subunit alcohol dehydrogenase family)